MEDAEPQRLRGVESRIHTKSMAAWMVRVGSAHPTGGKLKLLARECHSVGIADARDFSDFMQNAFW
jgi:hypothetical protein